MSAQTFVHGLVLALRIVATMLLVTIRGAVSIAHVTPATTILREDKAALTLMSAP